MSGFELILAVVIAIGLVGVLVPLLPGSLLVAGAVLAWGLDRNDGAGWTITAIAVGLIGTGAVIKYLIPGRKLQRSGVPTRTLLLGGAVGIVGFFVVPVVGLPLGFVLGVYLAEWNRLSRAEAWPATVAAIKAIGLGILIELGATTLAAVVWLIGALAA